MSGFIYYDGTAGNYASTPDAAVLDITGDIGLRGLVALDDWTPPVRSGIVSKWTTNEKSYRLSVIEVTGLIRLQWTTDGTTVINVSSTVVPTITNGSPKWIWATLDVDNGAGGHDVKFWTSDDGTTWTQLGATVTGAGATSIYSGVAQIEVGSTTIGTDSLLVGGVRRVQILNSTGETPVYDADFTKLTTAEIAAGSFTEDSANAATVTLNGTAWRYIWGSTLGAGGPQRIAGSGQLLRTGRAQS